MAGRNVTIGNVNIAMSANAAKLIQETARAESAFKKRMQGMMNVAKSFANSMRTPITAIGNLNSAIGGLSLASAGGVGVLGALATQAYQSQRELQNMAATAGVTMATMKELDFVAQSTGLSNEYFADALKDLNVRIADAAIGGGALVDFFAKIGEKASDWKKLDPVEQVEKFQKALSKMDTADARFWADEVNDSMFRVHSRLEQTGETLGSFMRTARSLGAGTSGQYIGLVNDMYESFSKLRLVLSELGQTTLALLSTAFKRFFDDTLTKLLDSIHDTDNVGKNIFELSKKLAIGAVRLFDTAYRQIRTFYVRIAMILGKFNSSFVDDLVGDATYEMLSVATQIADVQAELNQLRATAQGTGTAAATAALGIPAFEKRLAELKVQHEKWGKEAGVGYITKMIEAIEGINYVPSQLKPISRSGTAAGTNAGDLDEKYIEHLRRAREIITEINLVQDLSADSQLQQIQNQIALIAKFKEHYDEKLKIGGLDAKAEASVLKQIEEANEAKLKLEEQYQERLSELKLKEANELQQRLDNEKKLVQESMDHKMWLAQLFHVNSRAVAENQFLEDVTRLQEMLSIRLITEEEYVRQVKALKEKQAASELELEAAKWGAMGDGAAALFGEQSAAAQAAFAVQKGLALASILLAEQVAIANAMKSDDPWYTKAANVAASVGAIMGAFANVQSINGQFHNGGQIPADGTYYMEGGEVVIPKDKVGDYIDAVDKHGSNMGGGTVINSTINMGANLVDEKVMANALAKQQANIAALVQREQKKRPTRGR